MSGTKLSILTPTYNHAPFIRQALDSFLLQNTKFRFKVLINDDASTDGTREIISEYHRLYPDIIEPVFNDKNMGAQKNCIANFSRCDTEFAIICEGDDYFLDPHKLQKQVDFLERHPDASICFHPVQVVGSIEPSAATVFPAEFEAMSFPMGLRDLLERNFIQTNSAMYRWRFLRGGRCSDVVPDNILPLDHFIHLLHAEMGRIYMLPEIMSVYRRHPGGVWYGNGQTNAFYLKNGLPHIAFYRALEARYGVDLSRSIQDFVCKTLLAGAVEKDFTCLASLAHACPVEYSQAVSLFFCPALNNKRKAKLRVKRLLLALGGFIAVGLLAWWLW